jgi:outer membrane murein-binding lipoprotein Lpp
LYRTTGLLAAFGRFFHGQFHRNQEQIMADLTKLNAAVADVETKLDALLAKVPAVPTDDQPAIDAITAQVEAIAAKIPA